MQNKHDSDQGWTNSPANGGMSLSEAIAQTRAQAGMTQQQVADAMGSTQAVVAGLERGVGTPTIRTLQRFAKAVGAQMKIEFSLDIESWTTALVPTGNHSRTIYKRGRSYMPIDPSHPFEFLRHEVSRRRLLGTAGGAIAASAVATNGKAQDNARAAATPAPDGGWSFTDDKGVTVTLPKRPERVVVAINAAAWLWDCGFRPLAVFGLNISPSGDLNDTAGNVDSTAVEIVGNASEPIQIEKLILLEPDLIVTLTWFPDDPEDYWSIPVEILPVVEEIAPVVAFSAVNPADVTLSRVVELATLLGVDPESEALVAAQTAYEEKSSELSTLSASRSEISALFIYIAADDKFTVAMPDDWPDLAFYQSLGLNIVVPDVEPGTFWESLSNEEALKYPSDMIFNYSRSGSYTAEQIQAHPTLGLHPAVASGQIGFWNNISSYQGVTEGLERILSVLRTAEDVA